MFYAILCGLYRGAIFGATRRMAAHLRCCPDPRPGLPSLSVPQWTQHCNKTKSATLIRETKGPTFTGGAFLI